MVRRDVVVQLDEAMVVELDALARRHGVSRSELLRRGARFLLEADRTIQADATLVGAYRHRPLDAALLEASARLAAETDPGW